MAGTIAFALQAAANRHAASQSQRISASSTVAHPVFLPPPGCIPIAYLVGPGQPGHPGQQHLGGGAEGRHWATGDLRRFSNGPAHLLGPSTLNDASLWTLGNGELDYLLYNYLFMCTLNKVRHFRNSCDFSKCP